MTPVDARRGPPRWISLIGGSVVVAVATAIMLAMGRPAWCACGSIKPWYGNPSGPETSQHFTDPYTFTHVTHGVLLYGLLRLVAGRLPVRARGVLAVAAESAWEIFENTDLVIRRYRAVTMALGYYGDSALNSVGDILACLVGFALAARLSAGTTVVVMVLLELVLALLIRDGLLLNVLMLVWPIEAVKQWQLGR